MYLKPQCMPVELVSLCGKVLKVILTYTCCFLSSREMSDEQILRDEIFTIIGRQTNEEWRAWEYPNNIVGEDGAEVFKLCITSRFGAGTASLWTKLREATLVDDKNRRGKLIKEMIDLEIENSTCPNCKRVTLEEDLRQDMTKEQITEIYKRFYDHTLYETGSFFNEVVHDIKKDLKNKKSPCNVA